LKTLGFNAYFLYICIVQNKGNIQEETITISAATYHSLLKENESYKLQIAQINYQLAQLKRMVFGSKSERFMPEEDKSQLKLDFWETIEKKPVEEKQIEEVTYKRKKKSKGKKAVRVPLPSHLPREKYILEPTDKKDGDQKIGETVTEILEYQEAKLYVKSYHRPKYVTPNKDGVKVAELPSLPIPRGNAGPGLLAFLSISKFIDHLPFYRQRQILKRYGLDIAESTINDWFSATCRLLEPLYDKLHYSVLDTDYLMADETPISVLTAAKPGSTHKGYHWVYYSPLNKLVYFDYRRGRGRDGPEEILRNYNGTLQTDGYIAYDSFGKKANMILLACMAHARRKFEHGLENDPERAGYVLKQMQALYKIERTAREEQMSFADRKALRQKESAPILNELHNYLKTQLREVLPKSTMGKAIAYTLNLWPRLERYVEDGRYEIDNNLIENSIRPVALGRKNYLFAGSHEGAHRAAMIYSFVGSCKMNNIDPSLWLKDVLSRISDHKANKLDELLPPNWQPSE